MIHPSRSSGDRVRFEPGRLEPLVPLILAVHGSVLLAAFTGTALQWGAVLLVGLMGGAGFVIRRSQVPWPRVRLAAMVAITWGLMATSGGTGSFFLLWYFVIVSVYPLLIPKREGIPISIVVPLAYLSLAIFFTGNIPLVILFSRGVLLLFIGLLIEYLAARSHALATTDGLTGLYNYSQFTALGDREFERARREGSPLSVVFFDFNNFKKINDTYGHAVGDEVLGTLGKRIADSIRATDVAARIGGDEFAVIIPGSPHHDARSFLQRMLDNIVTLPVETRRGNIEIDMSVGIANLDATTPNFEALLDSADLEMYRQKKARQ